MTDDAGPATETAPPDASAVGALAPSTLLEEDGVSRSIEQRCADAAAVTDAAAIDQAAVLQVGFWTVPTPDPCDCANYNVNCRNFEETNRDVYSFDRDLPLDSVEHWRVGASVDGHPFHIHINPFLVCPEARQTPFDPIDFPHWRDTYLVNLNRKVDLITQYKTYTGGFVFHCHKLTHEDHGMMELIRVCDEHSDPPCGEFDWRECGDIDHPELEEGEYLDCLQALAATEVAIEAPDQVVAAAETELLGLFGNVCEPGASACASDADCGGATPRCSNRQHCVACTNNSHCDGPTPVCADDGYACVQCNEDADCVSPLSCDEALHLCLP